MLSKFKKGKYYTLALCETINDDPCTFARNATFKEYWADDKNLPMFYGMGNVTYLVNLTKSKILIIDLEEATQITYSVANIIESWSF